MFDGGVMREASASLPCGARRLGKYGQPMLLEVVVQPIGHAGVVDGPRIFLVFAFFPVAFVTIEELAPIALVFDYSVTFATILVPVVVLLSVPVPFLGFVDDHDRAFLLCAHVRDEYDLADSV